MNPLLPRVLKTFVFLPCLGCLVLPVFMTAGCGGGADDLTQVALKPSKSDEPASQGGTKSDSGNNGGSPATPQGGYGSIKGKIVISDAGSAGALGPLIPLGKAPVNPEFCGVKEAIPNEALVLSESGGLGNVFIWLPEAPDDGKDSAPHTAKWPTAGKEGEGLVFDQQNCTFVPHAMVMQTGKGVTVKSQDPVPHNVHTYPKFNDEFNTVIDPANKDGETMTYSKQEPEPLRVSCDFHKWMAAYHLPLDHPYGAVSNSAGEFTISDLPAGTHEFRIWHEGKMLSRSYEVTVEANKETPVEITFSLSQVQTAVFVPNLRRMLLSHR